MAKKTKKPDPLPQKYDFDIETAAPRYGFLQDKVHAYLKDRPDYGGNSDSRDKFRREVEGIVLKTDDILQLDELQHKMVTMEGQLAEILNLLKLIGGKDEGKGSKDTAKRS